MVDKTPFIEKYKELCKELYGIELTDEYAIECFEQLIAFLSVVYPTIMKVDNIKR